MAKVLYHGFWQNICMSIDALIFYHDTKTSLAKCIRTLKESCVCRVVPIHHIFVFISNKHINIINKNCTCYKSGQVVLIEDKVIDYWSMQCTVWTSFYWCLFLFYGGQAVVTIWGFHQIGHERTSDLYSLDCIYCKQHSRSVLSSSRSNSIVCNSDEGDIMYIYRIQTVIW